MMMIVGHEYEKGTVWGVQQDGEWEYEEYQGVKRIKVCHMDTHGYSLIKHTQHCLKTGKWKYKFTLCL
jgi:hypothetical protein